MSLICQTIQLFGKVAKKVLIEIETLMYAQAIRLELNSIPISPFLEREIAPPSPPTLSVILDRLSAMALAREKENLIKSYVYGDVIKWRIMLLKVSEGQGFMTWPIKTIENR